MRATIIAALAAVAAAAPAVTYTEIVDVYTTVWDDGSSVETPAPSPDYAQSWGNWDTPAASPTPVQAATTWAPSPAASSASNSYSGQATSPDYSTAVVQHHNAHRANHSAPDIVWDDSLAATALKIASSCVYAHDVSVDGGGFGQNIAAGAPASNISSVITDLFYNNEVGNFAGLYGEATPSNINDATAFDGWGHFTQVVWKGSTSVGCATYDCSASGLANTGSSVPPYFTVCNYKPAGNFLGEFADNVGEPLNMPSISWAST
ncbi:uncharacterized protein PV09_08464 [Verruconis gallopava]|uniref:SCP domain-containing protein n=1 Tax=Verruconis gallopava TaxID=253628 RepID=A0A0D1ZZY0_9PEZI|nr:uncharacterized protein PV09_08464 [Verruconis gallopava]KIV99947.1 hypothetical protein PV09_08464 [Verruconis gallopava]